MCRPVFLPSLCKRVHKGLLAVLLAAGSPMAWSALEEIVVTAQKRSESLQDVPVAVSAFTNETMNALGVNDASDLVNLTPGLSERQQSGSNKNYFLRGVGTNDFHLTSAPAVGQYFDEVTLTSGFHATAALFDMDRVEILKGPQNTLFGLNTTGGAVNYISVKPEIGGGTSGHVNTSVGNNSLISVDAAVGFDISDNVAARLSGYWNEHDGAFDSSFDGTDYGDDDTQAARAQILWRIAETTDVLLNVHFSESETNGTGKRALGTRAADGSHNASGTFTNQVYDFGNAGSGYSRNEGPAGTGVGVIPSGNDWEDIGGDIGGAELETYGAYLKITHDFGWAMLTSLTAFDNLDMQAAVDFDGSDLALQVLQQEDDRDTFQQELRLVSSGDGAFRWIAGAYYLDEEADSYTAVRSRLSTPGGGASPFPPGEGPPFQNFKVLANVILDHTKENLGIYAQGEYDLTDDLTLTFGVRWSDEEIKGDYAGSSPNVTAFSDQKAFFSSEAEALALAQGGYDPARLVSNELNNEDVGYTVKLDYQFGDDSMVYASWSRGFKGGALDIRAFFAVLPPNLIPDVLENSNLDPESLDAWEIGYKGSFADNSVQIDAAVFSYDYSDLQQFATVGGLPALSNAPESEIIGFDGAIKYANETGFYLQAGVSYLDSEVEEGGDIFLDGAELSNTPELSWTLLAAQDFEVGDGTLTIMANASYTDDRLVETLQNSDAAKSVDKLQTIDDFTLVNASATYRFGADEQYTLGAYVNNITEEEFCNDIRADEGSRLINDPLPPGPDFAHSYNLTCSVSNASTRTYGVRFGYAF